MADLSATLRTAVDTGRVVLGIREARKALGRGDAKLLVVAQNCPDDALRGQKDVPVVEFPGTNLELGAACGKPFTISAVAVLDPGKSRILKG